MTLALLVLLKMAKTALLFAVGIATGIFIGLRGKSF